MVRDPRNLAHLSQDEYCIKRNEKKQLRKFNKYDDITELHFGTFVLALYCYCREKVKYRLLLKRLFQRK